MIDEETHHHRRSSSNEEEDNNNNSDDEQSSSSSSGTNNNTPRRSKRKKTPKKQFSPEDQLKQDSGDNDIDLSTAAWTERELTALLELYNDKGTNWKQISQANVFKQYNRTSQQLNALYNIHEEFITDQNITLEEKMKRLPAIHNEYLQKSVTTTTSSTTTTPTRTTPKRAASTRGKRGGSSSTSRKRLFDSGTSSTTNENTTSSSGITGTTSNDQSHATARDRFTRSTRGRGKAKTPLSPKKITRKQKLTSEPLPNEALKTATDLSDPNLLSPNSKKAYESNKRLPMKLRGKGTHGNIVKKVSVQVLDGSPPAEQVEQLQQLGQQFSRVLTSSGSKKFCVYEWFYPTLDQSFWERNDFTIALQELKLDHVIKNRIPRYQLSGIRTKIANNYKIRRFSRAFLQGELDLLKKYREAVRAYHSEQHTPDDEEVLKAFEYISSKLSIGDRVYILDSETNNIYPGSIQSVGHNNYQVSFDDDTISEKTVPDTNVMALDSVKTIPLGKRSFSVMSGGSSNRSPVTPPSKRPRLIHDSTHSPSLFSPPGFSPIIGSPQALLSPGHNLLQSSSTAGTSAGISATSGISLSLANFIVKLSYKNDLVIELKRINTESKLLLDKGCETLPQVLCQRCAYVVVKLKEVNDELDSLANVIQQQLQDHKDQQHINGTITERQSGTSSTQHLQNIFQENRKRAAELVADFSRQIMHEVMKDADAPQLPASSASLFSGPIHQPLAVLSIEKFDGFQKRVQSKISDCIAFLLHLRSCIRDQSLTPQDIELTLDAASMALKSDSPETTPIYREIKLLIEKLKSSIIHKNS
jgi:hypothetical protein